MPGEAVVRRQRHVDHRAAARGRNARSAASRAIRSVAADVEPRHRPPALRLDRLGGREVLAAGVVDERVEPAAALEREVDDPLRVGVLADVAGHPRGAELRRRRREHLGAPAADHDLRAAAPQLGRRGAPEPRAAARDEHRPAGERRRRRTPRSRRMARAVYGGR